MARSDLLVSLVSASSTGDKQAVRDVVEAIIAEEKSKQHMILAERLSKALLKNGNGAMGKGNFLNSGGASKAQQFLIEITPRKTIDELSLSNTCRRACDQLIEEQHRSDVLRAHALEPRHRALLVGPPGNGKTSLAEAIANSLAVPLFVVRYEAMIGSFLGETATRLKHVINYAKTTPCVLFFDEFDAIGKERGDIHETGEIKRVVTSLLMQIDDLPSYTVVIAATNHAELLDRAVWRRFQLRLELPAPTQAGLARYLKEFCARFGEPLGFSSTTIAKKLGRISYAEAEQFCLDVRRQTVLSMGGKNSKQVTGDQLKLWSERSKVKEYGENQDDRISTTGAAKGRKI